MRTRFSDGEYMQAFGLALTLDNFAASKKESFGMSNIPPDIREKAENVHRALKSSRDANHLTEIIEEALLAEREAQRERDAKIAEARSQECWSNGETYEGQIIDGIVAAIRSSDTPTPQDET